MLEPTITYSEKEINDKIKMIQQIDVKKIHKNHKRNICRCMVKKYIECRKTVNFIDDDYIKDISHILKKFPDMVDKDDVDFLFSVATSFFEKSQKLITVDSTIFEHSIGH